MVTIHQELPILTVQNVIIYVIFVLAQMHVLIVQTTCKLIIVLEIVFAIILIASFYIQSLTSV